MGARHFDLNRSGEARRSRKLWIASGLLVLLGLAGAPSLRAETAAQCMKRVGVQATRCLKGYTQAVTACRLTQDPACEDALRVAEGPLDATRDRIEPPVRRICRDASTRQLGYNGVDDAVLRAGDACVDFAEDLLDISFGSDVQSLTAAERSCQERVARILKRFRNKLIARLGPGCFVKGARGKSCPKAQRAAQLDAALEAARRSILKACGPSFDGLGLSPLDPSASSLQERVAELTERIRNRARHFTQLVFPPNDLGPAADFGPFPVGVQTLELADPSRTNVFGSGPRPVTVEIYYPSTTAAVEGVPPDPIQVLGLELGETPAFRDVALAPGSFPLIVFSHGNNGIRIQSFFFAAHLASHGFVVASPDHHGNTFVDSLVGIVDPISSVNRPLDMSFLIDTLLAASATPGDFFEGAIDASRIGASGHSFGGFTTFALVGGDSGPGSFHDSRIGAAFPQAPAASAFSDSFFPSISVPILIVGGSLDETTPFPEHQQRPFDHLPTGASVVGLARIVDAGHFTFSDFCEVPRELLGFLGGFDEACEPRHLPWRHAHDIINFLALSFFDGVLNGNPDALARLDPASLASIEDLVYQSK